MFRPALTIVMTATFIGSACAQSERGAFVVTLGQDTVALEKYHRAGNMLEGVLLLRSPATHVVWYKAELGTDGSIARLETRWSSPSGEAAPPLPADAMALRADDEAAMQVTYQGADGDETISLDAPAGAVPLINSVYSIALFEHALRQGFAEGTRDFSPNWVALDRRRASTTQVAPRGSDSVAIGYFAGTLVAEVDDQGHILGLTGEESTAKIQVERVDDFDMEMLADTFGARDRAGGALGTMSPRDTAQGAVGGANMTVDYSRPSKRGRLVWGGVVPWGQVWRTGANLATHFSTDRDLRIGNTPVPAGRYTLFTLPTPDGAELIINKQTNQWGTVYQPDQDLARIPLKREELTDPVEQFTIAIEEHDGRSRLSLTWDDARYWVAVTEGG